MPSGSNRRAAGGRSGARTRTRVMVHDLRFRNIMLYPGWTPNEREMPTKRLLRLSRQGYGLFAAKIWFKSPWDSFANRPQSSHPTYKSVDEKPGKRNSAAHRSELTSGGS